LEVFYGILVWVGLGIAVLTALIAAWRSAHGVLIPTVGLLVATGAWITAKAAEAHDYHDADGWADCWPSCSALQRSVGTGLLGGLVMIAAFGAALAVALLRRR